MSTRYCPNCKKIVGTKLTLGQVACAVLMFLVFFPALFLYLPLHARKCPYCGVSTIKYEGKKK